MLKLMSAYAIPTRMNENTDDYVVKGESILLNLTTYIAIFCCFYICVECIPPYQVHQNRQTDITTSYMEFLYQREKLKPWYKNQSWTELSIAWGLFLINM